MAKEPEYGEVTAARKQAATAPLPSQPTPRGPEQIAQTAVPVGQAPPEGFTVRNPYTLLPSRVLFGDVTNTRQKTPTEENYDVGLLFDVLGMDDPSMKVIADELLGR